MEFLPLLSPLLTLCSDFFIQYPHSCFLYCMCTCIDYFSDTQFQKLLQTKFNVFSQRTLQILKDSESFRDNPDIVEDFFDLVVRYIRQCPQSIFSNPILPQIFSCAIKGLVVQHKQALHAVMQFFIMTIGQGINDRNDPASMQYKSIITALLQQYGDPLCNGLITGITDVLPMPIIKCTLGVFHTLISFNREISENLLTVALNHIPEIPKPSKALFLQHLISACDQNDQSRIRELVYGFATVVRQG